MPFKTYEAILNLIKTTHFRTNILFNYILLLSIGLVISLSYTTASADDTSSHPLQQPPALRFGILPGNAPEIIKARFTPLAEHIQQETGIKIELVIPTSYEDLLARFKNKSIDLARFGAYTYLMAQREANAEALVMRDIDLQFSTVFLVRPENSGRSIKDFKGSKFSFGSKLSTSGHLMPRYFLSERDINPETFFSEVLYSNGHDITAYWVRDGKVSLGAASSFTIKKMFQNGWINNKEISILWETPTYTDYVWAVQADLDRSLRDKLLDSFLCLTPLNPKHQKVLDALGAKSFLPANQADFNTLRNIIAIMEQNSLDKK
jgi:phosphonate transport system substrate-binding protein